jgi:hypothetical protein
VGPRASMGAVSKGKYSYPCRETKLCRPTRRLVTTLTELSRLLFIITCTCIIPVDLCIMCSVTETNQEYSHLRPPYFLGLVFLHSKLIAPKKGKVKGKVVPVLLLTEHHAMGNWGNGGTALPIL